MGASSNNFYRLPKIYKKDILLRPIVSSRDSITYRVAKVIADILKPLIGKSQHHIQKHSAL